MKENITEKELIFIDKLYDISYDYYAIILLMLEKNNYKYFDTKNTSMFEKDILLKLSMYLLTIYLLNEDKYNEKEISLIQELQKEMMTNYHIYNLKKEYSLNEQQINEFYNNANDYLICIDFFIKSFFKNECKKYTYFSVPALIFGIQLLNKKYINLEDITKYKMTEEQRKENMKFVNALLESGKNADTMVSKKVDIIVNELLKG